MLALATITASWAAGVSGQPMHIPDGFLSLPVSLAAALVAAAALWLAVGRSRAELGERAIPLMGVLAAFIFAAQMLNFPVAGGTSGHLVGGALAAILLGPWAAVIVLTAVLTVQALVFQDGGLVVLGANLLNMEVLAPLLGFAVFYLVVRFAGGRAVGRTVAAFLAGWSSVVAASVLASLELALSGTVPLSVVLPAMATVHVFIGLGEGVITVAALSFVAATRSDLLRLPGRALGGWR